MDAIRRIMEDAQARRELLWLRATARADEDDARHLERLDPGIVGRLRAAGADIDELPNERPIDRRERFDRLFDSCYERHASRGGRHG